MLKQNNVKKPLRACHIYYSFFYNAILNREINSLKERGFNVDVICLRKSAKEKIFQNMNGIRQYCIQTRNDHEKKPIIYFARLTLFFLKSAFFLSFLSLFRKYNVIHVTSPPDIMVFTAIIPKLLGAKVILDIHDIGPELFMRKLNVTENKAIIKFLKYLEKMSCWFADHVITVTDIWQEKLAMRSLSRSKCSVLLNVPDDRVFYMSSLLKSTGSNSVGLYYHGTFDEHFGVDTLIKAMQIVKEKIPGITLDLYGEGRQCDEFMKLAKELNVSEIVKFHMFVPFFELPGILRNADIGVVPTKGSVFSDEAVSMKSLEYISLGIPIVISRTKAHNYYFDDTMVKFFNPEDEYDLAQAIIYLSADEDEKKRLVNNAQTFMKENNWGKTKEIYFQIIDDLIKQNN